MILRINTIHGMATLYDNPDREFKRIVFDKKVSLNGGIKTYEWLISIDKFENLIGRREGTEI